MGADIKSLRLRIKSVDSTLHLTKAMGLVATSKIRRANEAMFNGREYKEQITEMINLLTQSPECKKSPYLRDNGGEHVKIIVIAGDRGLCGGYNANVFRFMRDYPDAEIIPIGKRACDLYGAGYSSSEYFSREDGYALAKSLCDDFKNNKFDRLGIVSGQYISMMSQEITINWLLPLTANSGKSEKCILFEPGENSILNYAVREYVAGVIMASVRESFSCEVIARRLAMDNAGKNAQQMISDLQLEYNRARQGAITQEITEIVAGSEI